jgi:hypothetical protein
MNKRARMMVLWLWFLCIACAAAARAGEFCPARVAGVMNAGGAPGTYAVRLSAFSPRSVTGALLLETGAGWYRAPFAPLQVEKGSNGVESPPIYLRVPSPAPLKNVWLAQAFSDDPNWKGRGVVGCAPDPERHVATGTAPKPMPANAIIAAAPIAPPLRYDCKTPFADARVDPNTVYAVDLDRGDEDAAQVDLDAGGKVVDVAVSPADPDLVARNRFADRVRHMKFTPAIAYCRPVPSTYFLSESALH